MKQQLQRYCSEPFRVFFPLAFLASIIGVALWPLSLGGYLGFYPLEIHTRWMITGFGGCLIVGFIGTAGPRFIGSDPWSPFELIWHYSLSLSVLTACLLAQPQVVDLLAGFWFLGVLGSMIARVLFDRHEAPPPGLPLALLALLTGATSCFALALHPLLEFSHPWSQFWRLLYFQGFLWLPILGVAPYLLPRFFGKPSLHSLPDDPSMRQKWLGYFALSLIVGLLLIASFALEIWQSPHTGTLLRASVTLIYLTFLVPSLFSPTKSNALALSLRWFPWCAAGAWILIAIYPHLRIGILHLMFIGGAATVMLAVATRVILGHNERHDRLATTMSWYHLIWSMLLLTAATRLSADFIPHVRVSHLSYAAGLWILLIIFWGLKIRNELAKPPPDPSRRGKCPKRPPKRSSNHA